MSVRTYGKLERDGGRWVLTGLEPHVAIRFKDNFRKVPRTSTGPYRLPADGVTAADLDWFISRYPLEMSPADRAALVGARRGFEALQAEAGRILSPDYQPPVYAGLQPGQKVRPNQGQAAELVSRFGGLLVADEVGEGKTYTGGASLLLPGALPGTVVCPPHLALQWRQKLMEFTTLKPVIVQGTKPYALPPCDVRIFSYTGLAGWVDMLEALGAGLTIFDEIHGLRHGTDTEKGRAAKRLTEVSRMNLGLSGTPIFNLGVEIWNIMQYLRPGLLGPRDDFQREWCGGTDQVKDPEALGTYLRDQAAMVRQRGKAPEPNIIVRTVDHDAEALEAVDDAAWALALRVRDGRGSERGMASMELDMLMRQATGISKAKTVAAYVRILVEAGEPVVLFGWHRAVYDIWLAELAEFNPVLFTGTESVRQKDASKAAFLSGWSKVFIMSLRSGEGLDDLQTVSKTCVIGELDWSPSTHKQNIGRLNREGQKCWPGRVDAIYLVSEEGSDPAIQEVLGLKASQAHGIVDPGLGPQRVIADSSPLERMVEQFIAKRLKRLEAA